jgi:hypothetical protein
MNKLTQNLALAILLAMTGFFTLPASAEGTFIGEACWIIEGIGDEEPQGTDYILLAVFDIGNNHLTLNGYSFSSDDESDDERMLLNGNAEIFGDQVFMSLNGLASDPDEILSISGQAKLSLDTLSGTVDLLGTGVDKTTEESGILADSGTLTITECPA